MIKNKSIKIERTKLIEQSLFQSFWNQINQWVMQYLGEYKVDSCLYDSQSEWWRIARTGQGQTPAIFKFRFWFYTFLLSILPANSRPENVAECCDRSEGCDVALIMWAIECDVWEQVDERMRQVGVSCDFGLLELEELVVVRGRSKRDKRRQMMVECASSAIDLAPKSGMIPLFAHLWSPAKIAHMKCASFSSVQTCNAFNCRLFVHLGQKCICLAQSRQTFTLFWFITSEKAKNISKSQLQSQLMIV
jgi:hypothetical protein